MAFPQLPLVVHNTLVNMYRICPIKCAVRGGNERVCVYLLTKKWHSVFHIKEFKFINCR